MKDSILKFAEQFQFKPEIQNEEKVKCKKEHYILGGMGGSGLCAGLFHVFRPGIDLHVHQDYGLPPFDNEFMSRSLFIASSYSGNTEETLDFAEAAFLKGYSVAIITTGGKLLEFAKKNNLPYVLIPDTGIQPRMALGFSTLAIASLVEPQMVPEIQSSLEGVDLEPLIKQAKEITQKIYKKIPIIYSSSLNRNLAYVWKISMNETGKIPAFQNVIPELNHNEIQSFDYNQIENKKYGKFVFIILHDSEDHPQNELRMRTVEELYQERGFDVISVYLEGDTVIEKVFKSIILSNWIAFYVSELNSSDPEGVPLIEEFKKRIKK